MEEESKESGNESVDESGDGEEPEGWEDFDSQQDVNELNEGERLPSKTNYKFQSPDLNS